MNPDWLWLMALLILAGVVGALLGHLLRRR